MPATGARRGNLVYHWKHGWIPLDHFAALQKAHGSHKGAERVMARHGIAPVGTHHPGNTPAGPHFRMSGTELRDRAAKGDHAAQAELARRAARKAEKTGAPAPERPKAPEVPKAPEQPKTPEPPTAAPPKAPEPPSRPLSPEGAYMRDRGSMPPAERVVKARQLFGADSEEHKNAVSAENAHIEEKLAQFPSAGPGHTIRSAVQTRYANGTSAAFATMHRHEVPNPNGSSYPVTIGRVQERYDQPGVFHAEHATYKSRGRISRSEYHDLGTFNTREDAHKAVATAETQHRAAQTEKRAKETATAQRKAAAAEGIAGPNGHAWTAVDPSALLAGHVGTEVKRGRTADQVAAKAKQSFKAGNYTVTDEANLTTERTKQLLRDITTAVDSTPLRGEETHFVVPTGHSGFKGGAGGFVYSGGTTVYLNPTLVSGAKTHLFTQGDSNDFHMPASAHLGHDSNVPTIVHELGHVYDNIHKHTRGGGESIYYPTGGGFAGTPSRFHSEIAPTMTRYARKNPAEGYAEAFMQYHVGGHGSHPAADAYAARYGWNRATGIPARKATA